MVVIANTCIKSSIQGRFHSFFLVGLILAMYIFWGNICWKWNQTQVCQLCCCCCCCWCYFSVVISLFEQFQPSSSSSMKNNLVNETSCCCCCCEQTMPKLQWSHTCSMLYTCLYGQLVLQVDHHYHSIVEIMEIIHSFTTIRVFLHLKIFYLFHFRINNIGFFF